MIPHLAWSVISTVKTNFIIWETRDWSWKPANFSTKPLAETQWKRADTFKSTEALQKHETMLPFSSYTFPVETVARKRNGILNHRVSATLPNCGNTLFHPVLGLKGLKARSTFKKNDPPLACPGEIKSSYRMLPSIRTLQFNIAITFPC